MTGGTDSVTATRGPQFRLATRLRSTLFTIAA
jgi:hypothetical protein